ncbi:TRAP transporter substrate-binding protein [Caldimonas thermodepolymerans]|jgi:tripartite ATP-independent periplasmic transporter solute receptor, DctP family|uniref:C4-dicarboxylate ABC transporter substrate-binding protein n=1 Tax=Caldimonas thermodepolymerans TaxID=215580 RepID=A0A2S5T8A9_9BURK|nr:TRAP transporter substrate-binding protein [Caldimonas thermodepolymerans]PPE71211.1 C4-dicarboxylate ABC transporter substrate-binding protein [Caldimonas thermodepolymerans]QPC32386.1 TRAP transporter substrate-binding protein [Caldimonas thermodepolymerans]RDH98767.1 tripartite ATP-independent transporter DctP family solute receptor [Caldimonas thermodepolymerans]TCP06165.1 tripartite ATP-independent transporter DctP family solute receptor [Caldimonas thermodepolymerans]UZG45177.1 TRAP t
MKLNRSLALVLAGLGLAAGVHAQTVLKIGYATSKESHYGVGSTVFCDEIEKGTQGRYKCQHFPNSALGGEREQIEAVQLGTQDLVNTSTGPLGNFVPEVKIVDIPFLFRDYDHARKVMDGPIGEELRRKMAEKGLINLAWTENGFRHMTNSRRAIVKAEDAAGLKMRTMENKVHMDGYKTFGILPTPMPFPELFTALQQGTVDGQENPIPVILAAKFSQVQKHLSLTGHVYSPAALILSPAVWNKLSDADKQVFLAAGKKAAEAQRRKVNEDEANGIAQLKREGMQVVEKVDGDSFRKAIAPAYQAYAREFGADRIAAIQAVK